VVGRSCGEVSAAASAVEAVGASQAVAAISAAAERPETGRKR